MITVQPNMETDASLHAQQVADATREGHAWAQEPQRTEAEVIEWAAVVLRDGPTRMGWSDHETRQIALAYLEGWQQSLERRRATMLEATLESIVRGAGRPSAHFTLHPDGRLEQHVDAWRAAVERGIIHQPSPPWLDPTVAEPCPEARPIRYITGPDPATIGARGATQQHD